MGNKRNEKVRAVKLGKLFAGAAIFLTAALPTFCAVAAPSAVTRDNLAVLRAVLNCEVTNHKFEVLSDAFAPDGNTAVIYLEWACGTLCGSGLYIELMRGKTGWKISRQEAAWIS